VKNKFILIENLTRTEKLRMMDVTWDDLSRDSGIFSSSEWRAQALKDTERALTENRTHFVSWDAAKKMLRDSAR